MSGEVIEYDASSVKVTIGGYDVEHNGVKITPPEDLNTVKHDLSENFIFIRNTVKFTMIEINVLNDSEKNKTLSGLLETNGVYSVVVVNLSTGEPSQSFAAAKCKFMKNPPLNLVAEPDDVVWTLGGNYDIFVR